MGNIVGPETQKSSCEQPLFRFWGKVEMSGIEPESERFVPRISTSVVGWQGSLVASQPTKAVLKLTAGARKPLFHPLSSIYGRHSGFVTPGSTTGRSSGWADAVHLCGRADRSSPRRRGAEQRS